MSAASVPSRAAPPPAHPTDATSASEDSSDSEPPADEAAAEIEPGEVEPPLPSVTGDGAGVLPAQADAESPAEGPEGPQPRPEPVLEPGPDTEVIRIAVGLGGAAPGTAEEKAIVDQLEASTTQASRPRTVVRRLRLGSSRPRAVCREGRDDLIVLVDYLPDRPEPVLDTYDCRLGQNLGVRGKDAATDPDLVTVLWDEHRQLVASGAKERQRLGLSPKVRTALIAGGAAIAVGAALALLLAGTLRQEVVVLKVSP